MKVTLKNCGFFLMFLVMISKGIELSVFSLSFCCCFHCCCFVFSFLDIV